MVYMEHTSLKLGIRKLVAAQVSKNTLKSWLNNQLQKLRKQKRVFEIYQILQLSSYIQLLVLAIYQCLLGYPMEGVI